MIKKFIAAIAMAATLTISLFTTMGVKAEAAYNYHEKAISVAEANIGVPYKWGGMSPQGFDCSGLVKYSYGKAGKVLPHSAAQMYYSNGYRVNSLQPGDLMFFAPNKASQPTHVAMYIGAGKMIMASSSKGVMITQTNNVYWKPKYIGAKRI
ncbi:C40 family peptidase [Neobacillus massiliamazoniensis]|uniref:Endopeptidase LytE n=1 Tax=Neobacillus massiliamazoniensis TaxID=1499688 RepID=A0A0U1P1K9_9BACI|nr:C40 family peptidase [Neobacillus massiliamazoniensis]CRK84103.1 endopeptidase LytE [Neobacillus massiliamazoniensis]